MARAASPSPAPLAAAQHQGLVLTAHGRMVRVQLDDGRTLECTLRGKRHDAVCGDRVSVLVVSDTQAVVEQILPRQSLIYRSDAYKSKQIAANVELLVLVVAVDTRTRSNSFSPSGRSGSAMRRSKVDFVISGRSTP